MHFCLSMLLLLLLAVTSSGECDYLFIVHDAGESNFLLPLVDDLNTKNVKVLALGEPAISIFGDLCLTPAELGVDTQIIDGNDGRNQTLKENDVNQILNALSPVHEAVLTGMVFAMQAQLSSAFLEAGSPRVIGVDDSYSLWSDDSILNTDFIAVKRPVLNEIFLSAYLSKSFAGSGVVPSVTGSPTLSTWRKTAMEGSFETRQVLQRKAHLEPSSDNVLVLYAGGYGDETYKKSVETFCAVAKELPSHFLSIFSPHPGYSPSFEEMLFRQGGCDSRVLIVTDFTSAQVVAASNASLSQCSTVGGQSLSITVPHAYVGPAEDACEDVFTTAGLIPQVSFTEQLREVLEKKFSEEGYYVSPEDVEKAGVPLDGEERVMRALTD